MHAATTPIVVASAVDQGYLPLALVVATSIARHARPDRPVEYHVLYDGPDHWAVDKLQRLARGPVTVIVHRLANPWDRFGVINGFPPSTLFRLAIPDVLAGHDRAIYLDCDLIVEADLGPLFDADLGGMPVGAVPCVLTTISAVSNGIARSNGVWVNTATYFADVLGLATPEQQLAYRQCGVQLLDLKALREMNYAGQMTDTVEQLGDRLAYCDQCAANIVLRDRFAEIEPRWNTAPFALHRSAPDISPPELRDLLLAQRAPGILHFGGEKPWHQLVMPGTFRWWRVALASEASGHFLARLGRARPSVRLMVRHLFYAVPALLATARSGRRALRQLWQSRRASS